MLGHIEGGIQKRMNNKKTGTEVTSAEAGEQFPENECLLMNRGLNVIIYYNLPVRRLLL